MRTASSEVAAARARKHPESPSAPCVCNHRGVASDARRSPLRVAVVALAALAVSIGVFPLVARADSSAAQRRLKGKSGAAEASVKTPPAFAMRVKAIYPVTPEQPGPIENAVMIVRDGKVVALGADLAIPADLPMIDLPDGVICPAFVDAGSGLSPGHSGPETASGAYRATDAFDPYSDYTETLARGTVTVHLAPGGHRLISGRGGVAKLAGAAGARVIRASADLCVNLGVFGPPPLMKPPFYASSDTPIVPARYQRPETRLGQVLELESQLGAARAPAGGAASGEFDAHRVALRGALAEKLPLRVQVREAADIETALAWLKREDQAAYLVALSEGGKLSDALIESGYPLVVRVEAAYRRTAGNLGADPDAFDPRLDVGARLARGKTRLALSGAESDGAADLQMIAALAVRGGLAPETALAAITRSAAEILGVAERVGSLAPGRDADFVVLSGRPLELGARVQRTYVGGDLVFAAPESSAVVVKAGTVWVGNGTVLRDASILIEDGKVRAVGSRVPTPLGARVIDAGPQGFVAPGFIDAHNHLGLEGDTSVAPPDLPIASLLGFVGPEFARVARAGVTTVLVSAYNVPPNGSRIAAAKTWGSGRERLILRDVAGVLFSLRGADPQLGAAPLKGALEAAKKYEELWKKHAEELEKWKKDKESGKSVEKKDESAETVTARGPDPITGTWEATISGGPIPEPVTATMTLKLSGTTIEGRMAVPGEDEEAKLTGTLDGKEVSIEVDQDTPVGRPSIKATLDAEDHMRGTVSLGEQFKLDFEAKRTDKSAVEFSVQRSKKHGKDGRPQPPRTDENLEPLRPLLSGKIPAVVFASTAAEIRAVLKLFADEYKIPVVLLNADDAPDIPDEFKNRKEQVGIVAPTGVLRRRDGKLQSVAGELGRLGVPLALQSNAEDGARNLPLVALFAAQQGMGGDAALRALTSDAARMFRIDDRVGSLEPGKDGDLVIFSGHPFDAGSRLERVLVGGEEVKRDD